MSVGMGTIAPPPLGEPIAAVAPRRSSENIAGDRVPRGRGEGKGKSPNREEIVPGLISLRYGKFIEVDDPVALGRLVAGRTLPDDLEELAAHVLYRWARRGYDGPDPEGGFEAFYAKLKGET